LTIEIVILQQHTFLVFLFPFGSSGISPLAQVDSLVKKILSEEPLIHESTKDTWPQKITSQPNVMLFGFLFFSPE